MREIILISHCQNIKRLNALEQVGTFHFKGVYSGELIKKIVLKIPLNQTIKIHEEYLLHVQIISVQEQCLWGKILKSKLLAECFMND
jgi:hypothetical protein